MLNIKNSKYPIIILRNNGFLFAILSLIIGGLIYILLRNSEPVFFQVIENFGFAGWIESVRKYTVPVGESFPQWFIYSLPNGLWAFSYALIITGVWYKSKLLLRFLWYASIPALILGFELLQLNKTFPGTFSLTDMLFGVGGIIAGIFCYLRIFNTKNHEISGI